MRARPVEVVSVETMGASRQMYELASMTFTVTESVAATTPEHVSRRELCHIVAERVLGIIQDGLLEVPAFHLTPVLDDTTEILNVIERAEGMEIPEWDYGIALQPQELENEPSLTDHYANIYDKTRGRMTLAAKQLFSGE